MITIQLDAAGQLVCADLPRFTGPEVRLRPAPVAIPVDGSLRMS